MNFFHFIKGVMAEKKIDKEPHEKLQSSFYLFFSFSFVNEF